MKQKWKLIALALVLQTSTACRTLGSLDFSWLAYTNHHVDEDEIPDEDEVYVANQAITEEQAKKLIVKDQPVKSDAELEKERIIQEAKLFKKRQYHQYNDFTLSVGAYFHRQGILNRLGEMGPTFGLTYASFDDDKVDRPDTIGFFVHWSFDHFFETNSKLLQPKFFNENYTNYLLAGGLAFRWLLSPSVQLHYKGGFALNFIEIDTFGPGDPEKDRELSDVTVSTVHKASLDVRPYRNADWRLGTGVFYYFAPNPLGKFSADGIEESTGGSWAWTIDITWEYY